MEINKIHNIDFLTNTLPDKCAKLIIADPPYYRTKGEFDFIWKTFEDYLKDVEIWALECERLLADNGTLLWYGDAKNIAYSQIIFDKHFNLLNSIVWENTNDHKQQIRFNEDLRTFAPLTERILMYENKKQAIFVCDEIRDYLVSEKKKSKLTLTDLNEILIGKRKSDLIAKRYFGTSQWELPTREMYLKLQTTGFFKKQFEVLREEYDELRRPFNNALHLGDVIRLPNYETSDYEHDTIKPEKLTRILITTCSRENDLVIVPFAGSGTECAMSAKEKRPFVGFEITEKHADMSNKRSSKILSQPTMF